MPVEQRRRLVGATGPEDGPRGPDDGWLDLTSRPGPVDYVRSLWHRRAFAGQLARNGLAAEHADSILGEAWFLLNPLLLIGVYYVVFGLVLQIDRGVVNFLGFLAVGVFTFDLSRSGLLRSSSAMVNRVGLIRSLAFPRALVPIAVTLEQTWRYLPQIVMTMVVLLATGEPVRVQWAMLVVVVAIQTVFTIGAGMVVARLTHHAEDVRQALPFFLRLAFYVSGILFSVDSVVASDRIRDLAASLDLSVDQLVATAVVNPFFDYVTLARHYLMASAPSPIPIGLVWLGGCAWAVVALVVGLVFFLQAERDYGRG